MLCLAFFLILGQAALLQHVAVHELEHAIGQDHDHCSFCAIGSHASAAATPQPLPLFTYAVIDYVMHDAQSVGFALFTLRLRDPPPSIA